MDQNPPQSTDTPQTPPAGASPVAPEEHTTEIPPPTAPVEQPANPVSVAPETTPSINGGESSAPPVASDTPAPAAPIVNTPPPPAAGTPQDANHKKNATMMYAVVTIVIIIIVGAGLMFMSVSSRSSEQPVANTTAVPPATAIPTEQPTMTPVPATPEEEAEAVNVTVDDTDIQQAEKDLQGL
jgi:hypothetical protein